MADYLSEKDWKSELGKPVNAGLRVLKTGLSDALRKYDKANSSYLAGQTDKSRYTALDKALTDLEKLSAEQARKHPLFKQAGAYMKKIKSAAEKRKKEIKSEFEKLQKRVEAFQWAKKDLLEYGKKTQGAVTKAEDFEQLRTSGFSGLFIKVGKNCDGYEELDVEKYKPAIEKVYEDITAKKLELPAVKKKCLFIIAKVMSHANTVSFKV